MSIAEKVVAVIVFILAAGTFAVAVLQFLERGPLLNNAYLYASREQREQMDKKPYYRQSAIVFCMVGLIYLLIGLSLVLQNSRILFLEIPLLAGALVYAVVSTVKIGRK